MLRQPRDILRAQSGRAVGWLQELEAHEINEHRGQENLSVFKLNEDGHRGTLALAETPGTAYLAQGSGW